MLHVILMVKHPYFLREGNYIYPRQQKCFEKQRKIRLQLLTGTVGGGEGEEKEIIHFSVK